MSINLEEIRERSVLTRDGFYHVVGVHYAIREADFNALVAEVEHLRGERAAVVAWLRGEPERLVECNGHRHADGKPCWVMSPMPAEELADAIERGEHRREEKP